MERGNGSRSVVLICAVVLMTSLGCTPAPQDTPRQPGAMPTSWMTPARMQAADFAPDGVTITGLSGPGDRVVLANPAGVSAAGSTGADGRFSIRLPAPDGPVLYTVELHSGRNEARAGYQLLLAPGPGPVAAMLSPGGAAVALGESRLLASVDYDGAGMLVAGVAAPGAPVRVSLDDGPVQTAYPDRTGGYVARFAAVAPGVRRVHAEQGPRAQSVVLTLTRPSQDLTVTAEGPAARVDWPTPGGGGQSTWVIRGPADGE